MADDCPDDYLEETQEMQRHYCEDCRVLTEALRDMEQQCREAEDERYHQASLSSGGDIDTLTRKRKRI